VSAATAKGATPLHLAATGGHEQLVRLVVWSAALSVNVRQVTLLLRRRADWRALDKRGRTAEEAGQGNEGVRAAFAAFAAAEAEKASARAATKAAHEKPLVAPACAAEEEEDQEEEEPSGGQKRRRVGSSVE
jgi:hypothetical protein